MAHTLSQARTEVRELTRHDSDTRVTDTQINRWLNHEYRCLRTWLQDIAPELYNVVSGAISLAAGDEIQLTSALATFERLRRVEWDVGDGDWRPLERASDVAPNEHSSGRRTFRVEGDRLRFGPDDLFEGDVRVTYWITPATLTGSSEFLLPEIIFHALILRTCGWVGIRDGDALQSRKEFQALADELLYGEGGDAARPKPGSAAATLGKQTGAHPQSSGLRRVWRR